MNILLGRQSILNREQAVIAYELLFRSTDNSPINCDTEATANVVANTLSMMSVDNVLGNKRGFVNIGIDILRLGLLNLIPPKRFVIEILETQEPSQELVRFIKKFKQQAYVFALDDFIITEDQLEHWDPILKEVQIVKVDVMDTTLEDLQKKTSLLKPYKVALLAEKVETQEMFQICMDLGYQYFQGYFFTKPDIIEGKAISPSIQGILAVIRAIQQGNSIDEVEHTIKLYPELIISLLKIVNSSSVSPIQEITSIKQAIALLGTRSLSQWFLLLLYSQRSNGESEVGLRNDPLFLTASQRGKTMELLLKSSDSKAPKQLRDEAFLVGLLSLCDALLHTPIEELVKELHLSESISDALLKGTGKLGELLSLTKSIECCNVDVINSHSERFALTPDIINEVSLEALKFSKTLADDF